MIKKLDLREFRAGDTLDSEHSSAPTKIWLTSDLRNFEAFGLGATGLERHNPGLFNVLMSSKSGATTGSLSDKFTNHRLWATTAAKLGRPFRKLPFRGAMYLINSGENHSALTDNIGWRRELLRRFTPARVPTTSFAPSSPLTLMADFGVIWADDIPLNE
jgi:hypothetical protein